MRSPGSTLAATALVLVLLADCCQGQFRLRPMSTARGMGKRGVREPLNLLLQQASSSSTNSADDMLKETLPAEWFAQEMQGNPALARLVVSRFIDEDNDGQLSAAELLRTSSASQ